MAGLDIYCEADSAWYDGKLSWDGDRVRVSFEGYGVDEDEWFDKEILYNHEKLITRVRRTSIQLQDSECRVREKEQNVCGCLVLGESRKYYDAVLKDVRRHLFPFPFQALELFLQDMFTAEDCAIILHIQHLSC